MTSKRQNHHPDVMHLTPPCKTTFPSSGRVHRNSGQVCKNRFLYANNVDPDQRSDLGLHYLSISLKKDAMHERILQVSIRRNDEYVEPQKHDLTPVGRT